MSDLNNEEPSADKELLLSKGITIFMGDVTETTMIPLVEWILAANLSNKPQKELTLGICSPGGDLNACFALIDVMKGSRIPIKTIGMGMIASCGLLMFISGTKGKRFSLPNSRIMVHQPSAGFQGQATDIEIHANEVLALKKRLNEIYSKHTGKSIDDVKKALERDNFMTPDTAKEFGLIDEVVENRS